MCAEADDDAQSVWAVCPRARDEPCKLEPRSCSGPRAGHVPGPLAAGAPVGRVSSAPGAGAAFRAVTACSLCIWVFGLRVRDLGRLVAQISS